MSRVAVSLSPLRHGPTGHVHAIRPSPIVVIAMAADLIAAVWVVGGMVCASGYLALNWSAFRSFSETSGYLFEAFHFGTRAILIVALWPLLLIGFAWEGMARLYCPPRE